MLQPAVDVVGTSALFVWARVEYGEAVKRQVARVKRSYGKNRLGLAAGDDDHAAAPGHQVDGTRKVRFALRFVPDVHSLAARKLADAGWDIVGPVVQDQVHVPTPAKRRLLFGPYRCNHPGGGRLGHLHDHGTNATRAAVDKDNLARLKMSAAKETEVGGNACQRRGRGIGVGNSGRRGIKPLFLHARVLGERPLPAEQTLIGAPHPIARLVALDAGPDGFDPTGEIATGNEGLG